MREENPMNATTSGNHSPPQEEKARFTAVNASNNSNGNGGTIVVGHHRPAATIVTSDSLPQNRPQQFEDWSEHVEQTPSYKRKRSPEPTNPLYPQQLPQLNAPQNPLPGLPYTGAHESGTAIEEEMNVGHAAMEEEFSDRGNGGEEVKVADVQPATGQDGGEQKKRKRQFANRTKTGCITCRRRKKKCDEGKPECTNCRRGGFVCEGYTSKVSWPKNSVKNQQPVSIQSKVDLQSASASPTSSSVQPAKQNSLHQLLTGDPGSMANFSPQQRQLHLVGDQTVGATSPNARVVPAPTTPQASAHEFGLSRSGTAPTTTPGQLPPFSRGPSPGPVGLFNTGDPGSEKQKMLSGLLYYASAPELVAERDRCRVACFRFNNALMLNSSRAEQGRLFIEILRPDGSNQEGAPGGIVEDVEVETPFHCSYGANISLGKEVKIGPNCTILDSANVIIKARTVLEADVKIYTTIRSSDPRKREAGKGPESAKPVIIEEDCLIGGNVTILAGVKISKGAVIGAGSVVSADVPPYTVVAGNPASVMRGLYQNGVET